jgi:hypothetical protein
MRRHQNALAIQGGACNPSGIANAIVEACREARDAGQDPTEDVAVRLMVHQLAYICRISEFENDFLNYSHALEACEKAA